MATKQNRKAVPACFACTTSYQLMGAISIVQNEDLIADLYLFGMFNGYEEIARRLATYKIFQNIVSVDCRRYRSHSLTRGFLQVLNSKKEVGSFLQPDISYDVFYSSSRAHVKLLMRRELERRNPEMCFVTFEDGLGTYSAQSHELNSSRLRRLMDAVLGWDSFKPSKTIMLVTHPELFELPKRLNMVPIKRMPSVVGTESNRRMFLDVFDAHEEDIIKERVILFDVTRGIYYNDLDVDTNMLDECYQMVVDKFSCNNVICKPHPRSIVKTKVAVKEYVKTGIPVEILYAGMPDLEERILIGTFSTALFTPKMMFDKEPTIVCLHKMVWPSNKKIPPVFEKLSRMYKHQDRLFAPENLSELNTFLRRNI